MAMRAIVAILSAASVASSMELTKETWDAAVSGKTVFVKFLAPWCGHCKALKPAWDQLIAEYKDSKTILVADVDCEADGKSLCEEHEVMGFPTIKYGEPFDLQDYEGERELDDLKKFAKENLGPKCGPKNLDLCDDAKKAHIAKFTEMAKRCNSTKVDAGTCESTELDAEIKQEKEDMEEEKKEREKEFNKFVKRLQKRYDEARKQKDEDIKEMKKDSGLGLMKAVAAQQKSQAGGAADKKEL